MHCIGDDFLAFFLLAKAVLLVVAACIAFNAALSDDCLAFYCPTSSLATAIVVGLLDALVSGVVVIFYVSARCHHSDDGEPVLKWFYALFIIIIIAEFCFFGVYMGQGITCMSPCTRLTTSFAILLIGGVCAAIVSSASAMALTLLALAFYFLLGVAQACCRLNRSSRAVVPVNGEVLDSMGCGPSSHGAV